ncbi:MFS transporter [Caryophanon tenue]|uniref:Fosmidomycin resistance protein n=1 Tax=Caryophanon tenue TaxID=33978 RepID=A0A1C0YHH9_9BACL|nr:MFS transporter [Caryophanon tenue]OCS86601.1 Fosmidomycin resistance protein [Caryophanon tenue]
MTNSKVAQMGNPVYPMMVAIGIAHLINDSMQSVVPAMYPLLERDMGLTFTQLGIITLVLNVLASVLQPVVGFISDKKPMPYALPLGMASSFIGIALIAFSTQYWMIIVSVCFLGLGSAVFHPEGSRVSFMAAGNKRGLAQSIYQVGGNSGQALAPLISAFILVPFGQTGAAYVLVLTAIGIVLLTKISAWYKRELEKEKLAKVKRTLISSLPPLTKRQIGIALTLLMVIIFARSFYVTSMTSFYVFYIVEQYGVALQTGQLIIFMFMACGVIGTFFGGPLSDRIGRKNVILLSVVVPIPLCILLPFAPLWAAMVLLIIIGTLIMISFSVTVVYAQELVPTKIGTMAGLTVGFAFGMGGIGGVVIGVLIDTYGLDTTMIVLALLTILMLVAVFLPKDNAQTR